MAAKELDGNTHINCGQLSILIRQYGLPMPIAQLAPREFKLLFSITEQLISKPEGVRIKNELSQKELSTLQSLEPFC